MTKEQTTTKSEKLADQIIEGIQDKKGEHITKIDLRNIHNSISDFFVVCHGNSNRQVDAIADSVLETVREKLGDRPNTIEGRSTAEWILLDYVDVVVHVFQEEVRNHYAIEELWADAGIEQISQ